MVFRASGRARTSNRPVGGRRLGRSRRGGIVASVGYDTRQRQVFARRYDKINQYAERGWLGRHRERLLAGLTGDVLEIGAGTGGNLSHYRAARQVILAEPAPAMRAILNQRLGAASVPVRVLPAAAERLPVPDASVDVVVSTLVLCSVEDLPAALAEVTRVLRPYGRLVFLEHVRGLGLRGWTQDRVAGLWSHLAAGCRPNRDLVSALCSAGFTLSRLETFKPWPSIPVTTPMISGAARRPDAQAEAELRWLTQSSV
jgi:SAM-dependent methyltransferase